MGEKQPRRRARLRSLRWLGLLVAAPLVLSPSGAVATPASGSRDVNLVGSTSITWSGARGIRLHVPKRTQLPTDGGTRLFVKGGTFAFVRYITFRECAPPFDFCNVQLLSYVREWADMTGPKYRPGIDHERETSTPAVLEKGTYEVYLFTDGVATLEFHPTGYSGKAARVAGGRVNGSVSLVGSACPTAGCTSATGYAGRARFGGTARDVGSFGFAEIRLYNFDTVSYPVTGVGVAYAQPHPGRVCVYPSLFNTGSPAASDHPTGCDVVSPAPGDTVENASRLVTFASLGVVGYGGSRVSDYHPQARGQVYLGFQAANAYDLPKPRVLPYAIFFRYGIS